MSGKPTVRDPVAPDATPGSNLHAIGMNALIPRMKMD
jgi:hypothetical protein